MATSLPNAALEWCRSLGMVRLFEGSTADQVGVVLFPRRPMLEGQNDSKGLAFFAFFVSGTIFSFLLGCVCVLLISRGMSKDMKLQAKLVDESQRRRRAEASSKYKSQFLANMSHELRTPMAAVIGLLDVLLGDEYLTSEQVAMVSQIRQCSNALLRLLNNILDLSKVESGKLVLEEADFDVQQELEVLVDMFSVQCTERSIEIVLDLEDNFPRLLKGDSARTVQVFANLIANAIKFTTSGYVIIRGYCDTDQVEKCALEKSSSGSSEEALSVSQLISTDGDIRPRQERICASFEVEDTGSGIDPSKWEEIFDSFVQADSSTTRTNGGSGLGLCIVRSLVQKMGGEIKVVKKDGPGTLMKFHLYLKRAAEAPGLAQFKDTCKFTFSREILRRSKILLSLQGQAVRKTMHRWMTRWGLDVMEVGTLDDTLDELDELLFQQFQRRNVSATLQPLAVIDISLLSDTSDLDELDKFIQQGVLVGWLLNQDTSSTLKEFLRNRGYLVMAYKPLYKSKLLHLLRMLVGVCEVGDRIVGGAGLTSKPERHRRSSLEEVRDSAARPADMKSLGRCSLDSALKASSSPRRDESDRRRSDTNYAIYKPTNYLDPDLINLGNSKAVVTGGAFDKSGIDSKLVPSSGVPSTLESSTVLSQSGPSDILCQYVEVSRYSVQDALLRASSDLERSFKSQNPEERRFISRTSSGGSLTNIEAVQDGNVDLEPEQEALVRFRPMQQRGVSLPNAQMHKNGAPGYAVERLPHKNDKSLSNEGSNGVYPVIPRSPPKNISFCVRPARVGPSASRKLGSRDALKGVKILLAEDTPVLERVARRMLENLGALVVPVSDGLQALDTLTEKFEFEEPGSDAGTLTQRKSKYRDPQSIPFDVVLMDCQMPVMDGYEATRKIRDCEQGTGCRIPIIALTAHAMSSDEAKCLEVGMDAYLTKPIDAKLMISTISSFSNKAEKHRSPAS